MALLFAGNGAGWLERNFKLAVIVAGHTVRCEQSLSGMLHPVMKNILLSWSKYVTILHGYKLQ